MTTVRRRIAALTALLAALTLIHAAPARAQAPGDLLVRLISVYAQDISESGHDELYLLRRGNGLVWPGEYPGISTAQNDCIVFDSSRADCPEGSNVRAAGDHNINWANLVVAPNTQLTLELWDEDLVGDDKLGSLGLTAVEGRRWDLTWAKSGEYSYRFSVAVIRSPYP
ncbi:hypothetical protein [Bailinhaonella thermotolerans]|uniref:Uncharacterized protein n=1 Tax=Bailinhaonella thermotolerans TaxID=1070861 RepID=A0A3A4A9R0_9ACTN|nr:hypothetical protein [Bailinhaonella thermotolerans]RJL23637.1 hypothetical protein D5H75_32595 [Bailinhaonella thermotolerans]